ncbi:MAG TPA: RNA polymerase sigma-70 factor [Bacteroidetes bacterium]|nr:RNA polymerase sigma-70 factor [Bacteroidota bacterium]
MTLNVSNREEFKQLYLNTYGVLVNYALSKTNDLELSKEIVQNVFVKFWNNRERININSSIKSYLFSMVRNNIIDHYRKVEKISDLSDARDYKDSTEIDIDKDAEILEFKYNLKKAISQLKEKRRKIFELSKFEGLTYREIADYLKISERSVEDNMAKAIKEIREYFIVKKLI